MNHHPFFVSHLVVLKALVPSIAVLLIIHNYKTPSNKVEYFSISQIIFLGSNEEQLKLVCGHKYTTICGILRR